MLRVVTLAEADKTIWGAKRRSTYPVDERLSVANLGSGLRLIWITRLNMRYAKNLARDFRNIKRPITIINDDR